jgi:hypothetical protein
MANSRSNWILDRGKSAKIEKALGRILTFLMLAMESMLPIISIGMMTIIIFTVSINGNCSISSGNLKYN